jgi:hypothetical protein
MESGRAHLENNELMERVQRLTIDTTVARDLLDPKEPRHALAHELIALARSGQVDVAVAPQGHRLDADGDLGEQLRQLFLDEGISETPQLAYPSEVTFPSESLHLGHVVHGFREAWDNIISDWRSHEGKPPKKKDRMHIETHIAAERDVFVTDDGPLQIMCRRLREEQAFPITAKGLGEFLDETRGQDS